jgi:glycosyltransferase involved in cell wall biosynthesis
VAAPGLRVAGLAEGLRAHGFDTEVVVVKHIVSRVWNAHPPIPHAPHTLVLPGQRLMEYLTARRPVVAVMTNSNQINNLHRAEGVRFVFDFFAPKVLEMISDGQVRYPLEEVQELRRRKVLALSLADAIIVNGAKKLPYVLAWLLQTDRDARSVPTAVVPMCVSLEDHRPARIDGPLHLGIAGYIQAWSTPNEWVRQLDDVLSRPEVVLDVVRPRHWGGVPDGGQSSSDGLTRLATRPNVRVRDMLMTFSEYREFLAGMDLVVDLFDYNLEREYAMVTRAVVALACGVPVVHPPFTEVAPLIDDYEAGWLVDPADSGGLRRVLDEVLDDRQLLATRTANAQRLATEVFEPARAVKPLVSIIDQVMPAASEA